MRNFPYRIVRTELPHNKLSYCIIKCRARTLSNFDKKWLWRISNPSAFSLKEKCSLTERRTMTEHWSQARYPLRHGGSCWQWLCWWCVYLHAELRKDSTRPHKGYCTDNLRAWHFILQGDGLGFWAANLCLHNSYRTESSASVAMEEAAS